MYRRIEVWLPTMSLLLALVFTAGCQSCQGTKDVPPASGDKPHAAKPDADRPAAAAEEEVDEDALVLLAEGDEEDGAAPFTVTFSVESLLTDEIEGAQYKWDFGDGSPVSTEAGPAHTYEKAGSYTATIRIVDGAGQLGWDEVDIEVEEP